MPPHLRETLLALRAETSPETFQEFLREIGGSLSSFARLPQLGESHLDVSELDTDELKNALLARINDHGQDVLVAWPGDRTAAKVPLRAALERLDDLWYPSMDDLVIIDRGSEAKSVVVLDHEERLFTFPLARLT